MKPILRHRRLYAFYNSKVLNTLSLLVITFLLMMDGNGREGWLLPLICAATSAVLFIGYALWLWIKKPAEIVIDPWLSDLNVYFVIYFLAVVAMRASSIWWFVFESVAAILAIFISLARRDSTKVFMITEPTSD